MTYELITPELVKYYKIIFPNYEFANLRKISWLERSFAVDFPAFVIDYINRQEHSISLNRLFCTVNCDEIAFRSLIDIMKEKDVEAKNSNSYVFYFDKGFLSNLNGYNNFEKCYLRYCVKKLNF